MIFIHWMRKENLPLELAMRVGESLKSGVWLPDCHAWPLITIQCPWSSYVKGCCYQVTHFAEGCILQYLRFSYVLKKGKLILRSQIMYELNTLRDFSRSGNQGIPHFTFPIGENCQNINRSKNKMINFIITLFY